MGSIYEFLSYRQIIASRATELKAHRPGWTLQKLANKSGIQPPYLTNVLKEKAHLSADQLYAIAELLSMDEEEIAYTSSLLEWERSGHAARKSKMRERIEAVRKEKLSTKAHIKKQVIEDEEKHTVRFFLNPYYRIVNSFLGVQRFSQEPEKISKCLKVSRRQVDQWLKDLVEMGFARKVGRSFEKEKANFHLPPESPLFLPHQSLLQKSSDRHLQGLPADQKYNFALTFSADEATREKVQREFMKFLKTIEGDVKSAPADEIYGLSFDLFKWSHDEPEEGEL